MNRPKNSKPGVTVPQFPPEYVCINLSQPLIVLGKCRFCGKPPSIYFFTGTPARWRDATFIRRIFQTYMKRLKRLCYNYYLSESPKMFSGTDFLSYQPYFKSYNPALHRNRIPHTDDEYQEYLTCQCGACTWSFNEKSNALRRDIIQRKARYKYPKKFKEND